MRIIAEETTYADLKPGELFAQENQTYWDKHDPIAVGRKVCIRTELPCGSDLADRSIYRIHIEA